MKKQTALIAGAGSSLGLKLNARKCAHATLKDGATVELTHRWTAHAVALCGAGDARRHARA